MAEKTLQEITRAWREQYEKARVAFERNNLDYAITLLCKLLEQEPAFYTGREVLRAAQFKKAGAGARGGGLFRKMLGSGPKIMQAQVALRRNPLEALRLAEEILCGDPNNLSAHKLLAEAALAADLPRTAQLSLEIVHKQDPRDREAAVQLAQLFAKSGQGARAEAMISAVAREFPHDPKLADIARDIAANRTLNEGGYAALESGGGSYRDILKDEKEAVSLEQEKRDYKAEKAADALLAEYQQRRLKEPDNLRLLRAIADLHVERKEFDQALACYQQLAGRETGDPTLERAIAQTRLRQLDLALAQLDPLAPDVAQRTEALQREKREFALQTARARVERYPNDLQFRFELALLYLEADRLSEAIQELQKAQNSPHIRIQALFHLGQCFARKRMFDLAARTFQNAIAEKPVFDEEKKELIYALGTALEAMGRHDAAIEQFKALYEADIGFKDVAARVDAHYAAQG